MKVSCSDGNVTRRNAWMYYALFKLNNAYLETIINIITLEVVQLINERFNNDNNYLNHVVLRLGFDLDLFPDRIVRFNGQQLRVVEFKDVCK